MSDDILIALSEADAESIQATLTDFFLNGAGEVEKADREVLKRFLVLLVAAKAKKARIWALSGKWAPRPDP